MSALQVDSSPGPAASPHGTGTAPAWVSQRGTQDWEADWGFLEKLLTRHFIELILK